MLQVDESESNSARLTIKSIPQFKEWLFAGVIAVFACVPLLFFSWSDQFDVVIKALLAGVAIWAAAVSLGDSEITVLDRSTNSVRISQSSLYRKRVLLNELDNLTAAEVESVQEPLGYGKFATYYRAALEFEDGIKMPITKTLFVAKEPQDAIVARINQFLGQKTWLKEKKGK